MPKGIGRSSSLNHPHPACVCGEQIDWGEHDETAIRCTTGTQPFFIFTVKSHICVMDHTMADKSNITVRGDTLLNDMGATNPFVDQVVGATFIVSKDGQLKLEFKLLLFWRKKYILYSFYLILRSRIIDSSLICEFQPPVVI